jgi:hypothetical protein
MSCKENTYRIIIISLLMPPLLGPRPSLWITHKENRSWPTTRAQFRLVGANECKCSRDQRLNVPSEGGARDNKFLVTHLMTYQRCLTYAITCRSALTAGPLSYSYHILIFRRTQLKIMFKAKITLNIKQKRCFSTFRYFEMFSDIVITMYSLLFLTWRTVLKVLLYLFNDINIENIKKGYR